MDRVEEEWGVIQRFDLYEEEELNELLYGLMMRHNSAFHADIEQFITGLGGGGAGGRSLAMMKQMK